MNDKKQFTTVKIDSTNTDGYGKVFVESHKKIRSVGLKITDKTNRCNQFNYEWDKRGDFYGEFFGTHAGKYRDAHFRSHARNGYEF